MSAVLARQSAHRRTPNDALLSGVPPGEATLVTSSSPATRVAFSNQLFSGTVVEHAARLAAVLLAADRAAMRRAAPGRGSPARPRQRDARLADSARAAAAHSAPQRGQGAPARLLCLLRAGLAAPARHAQGEAGLPGAPLPRVLELATSKATDLTAFDRSGPACSAPSSYRCPRSPTITTSSRWSSRSPRCWPTSRPRPCAISS
eukprot:scaffold37872_cov60-Phaeocystis_antarctica.AAC.1